MKRVLNFMRNPKLAHILVVYPAAEYKDTSQYVDEGKGVLLSESKIRRGILVGGFRPSYWSH